MGRSQSAYAKFESHLSACLANYSMRFDNKSGENCKQIFQFAATAHARAEASIKCQLICQSFVCVCVWVHASCGLCGTWVNRKLMNRNECGLYSYFIFLAISLLLPRCCSVVSALYVTLSMCECVCACEWVLMLCLVQVARTFLSLP